MKSSDEAAQSLIGGAAGNAVMKKSRTKGDFSRALDYVKDINNLPEDSPIKQGIRCFLKWGVKPLILVCMAYVWVGKKLYAVYQILPTNIINMIFGVGLCFFGGTFFMAFAAVEAAKALGGVDLYNHLRIVYEEGSLVAEASLEDDKADLDKDGTADVEQMSTNELINHKAFVAMKAVKDPMRLQAAMVSLGNIWLAVIATLKFQFAKTVAVALGIADMLSLPAVRIAGPFMAGLLGPDLNHWVHVIIDTTIKFVAVFVASMIQSVISAFYSGLRGGKLFADGIFNIFTDRGWMDKLPDCITSKPFDPNTSYLDEIIAYPVAAVGFYYQLQNGFALDFPLSLILFPCTAMEWVLRWQVYT